MTEGIASVATPIIILASVISLVVRFVRGSETVRQQVLWLLIAVLLVILINVPIWFAIPTGQNILLLLSFPLIPAAVTIAVLRHGLYDVRIVLSRVVPGDDVIGQPPHTLGVAASGEILEGADADVAGGHAGQHGAWQGILTDHLLAGDHCGERARGGNAEGYRFADDVFAQHRAQRCAAIAAARERRRPRALELDVAPDAVEVDDLAEKDGAAIAELRHEVAELMAGIGQRDRLRAVAYVCRPGSRRPRASPAFRDRGRVAAPAAGSA